MLQTSHYNYTWIALKLTLAQLLIEKELIRAKLDLLIVPKLGVVYDVVGMAKLYLAMRTHIPSILHRTSSTGSPPPSKKSCMKP